MAVRYQRLPDDFEGNFEALRTPETWMDEADRLLAIGIERASVFGSSCPECYLPVPPHRPNDKGTCACETTAILSGQEELNALGLNMGMGFVFSDRVTPL